MYKRKDDVIFDRYQIIEIIHEGGFGLIYLAQDIYTQQKLAIKQNINPDPKFQKQLLIEADILQKVHHPNLPKVICTHTDGNSSFIVRDYIDGINLEDYVEKYGELHFDKAIEYITQIANAVAYLHDLTPSIFHRDIKPANIILTPESKLYLIDFGIAKEYSSSKTNTVAQAISPGYSPPEQYSRGKTTNKSDIYSLAATLFFLITGFQPQDSIERFQTDSLYFDLQYNFNNFDESIYDAIRKAMSLQKDDRFDSVNDFIKSIQIEECSLVAQEENYFGSDITKPNIKKKHISIFGKFPMKALKLIGQTFVMIAKSIYLSETIMNLRNFKKIVHNGKLQKNLLLIPPWKTVN
jgi:eukaryotic-like serine/threonine-protein kinase